MVGSGDLKIYKSSNNSLGGPINRSARIPSATFNNMFGTVTQAQQVGGDDTYNCMYLANDHATEAMDQFKWWLGSDTVPVDSTVKWGLEPPIPSGYRWSPSFVSTGSNKDEIADAPENRLTIWTIAAWFKTPSAPTPDEGWILNKGGSGVDTAGENNMYSLFMNTTGNIRAGFETSAGVDNYVTSPSTYANGQWHWALAYYDGTTLSLFVDNATTAVATLATSSVPEASTKPVRINQNSRANDGWFPAGAELDEVRLWNRAMTDVTERTDLFTNNTVNSVGLIIERKFGADNAFNDVAQVIANAHAAPVGVTWRSMESKPTTPTLTSFKAGRAVPVWVWWHVEPNCVARKDDKCFFNFAFQIPSGGTAEPPPGTGGGGDPGGGGTGGNPVPTPTNYKICFCGDWGCENETDDVINLIKSQNYDYVFGLGDNAYESASCWTSRFKFLRDAGKFNSCYGNHEYSESGGIGPYKTFFSHDKTYFSSRFQNIFLVWVDNYIDQDPGSTQHNFVKSAFESVDNDTTIKWRIFINHQQWWAESKSSSSNEFNQVGNFADLCTQHKVNFIMAGHRHNWQRTYQLKRNPASQGNPTIVGNTSPYTASVGYIHVISGTGGHDHPGTFYSLGSQPAFNAYQNSTHNGVWEVIASNNGLTWTCQFREIGGDTFDTFVINA